jgi:UPF0042 nucleotide-binding protein
VGDPRLAIKSKENAEEQLSAPCILIITGMSGAGKSSALKILEDIGFEAVDNLPLTLLDPLCSSSLVQKDPIAIGIDVRTRDFKVADVLFCLEAIDNNGEALTKLIFLDSENEILRRRYSETRRKHPLAPDRPVMDGIILERALISELKDKADLVLDTTDLKPQDLKKMLKGYFEFRGQSALAITIVSFAFGRGIPREADLVFDVRFLRNPYYEEQLRHKTGRDPMVMNFILSDKISSDFLDNLNNLFELIIPRYEAEGKSYLTICIGCTGGVHRSVFVAEKVAEWFKDNGHSVDIRHRDINRDSSEF